MSCPTNCVSASCPWTWLTRNWSLICILLKSPVRSWTVTSVTRPTSLSGVSVGVSPRSCLLNISGARRLYHTFAFHLSLILRAAARDFFSAMENARKGGVYLRVGGWMVTTARISLAPRPRTALDLCHDNRGGKDFFVEAGHARHAGPAVGPHGVDASPERRDALVVAVLVSEVCAGGGFVRRRARHLDVGTERDAAVRRPGNEEIRAHMGRIVPGVVEAHADRAVGRVHREPLVELVVRRPGRLVVDTDRCAPRHPAVRRASDERVHPIGGRLVRPRAVEGSSIRPLARVRAARGVDEGAPERLRRNADVKRSHRGSDRDRGAERRPAIRR